MLISNDQHPSGQDLGGLNPVSYEEGLLPQFTDVLAMGEHDVNYEALLSGWIGTVGHVSGDAMYLLWDPKALCKQSSLWRLLCKIC